MHWSLKREGALTQNTSHLEKCVLENKVLVFTLLHLTSYIQALSNQC
jgi:hypothetical protein